VVAINGGTGIKELAASSGSGEQSSRGLLSRSTLTRACVRSYVDDAMGPRRAAALAAAMCLLTCDEISGARPFNVNLVALRALYSSKPPCCS
jgi:hypothetical protein